MTTDNQDKQQPDNDTLWDIVSDIVDQLQFATETAKSSAELIQKLLTVDQLPGISREELSIIYCEYGTRDYQLIVYAGQEVEGQAHNMAFAADNQYIKNVIHNSIDPINYPWFKTAEDCIEAGFGGFKTVLIIPMRLGRNRRLGAFIIHSMNENVYSERLKRVLDVLSDRLAALIRSLRRGLRAKLSNEVRNKLLGRLASSTQPFESEQQILEELLSHIKEWYKHDNIYVLMKNPLDIQTYYLATDNQGNIVENFRTTSVLDEKILYAIVGGKENLQKMTTTAIDDLSGKSAAWRGSVRFPADLPDIKPSCLSWLGVTIHHPDGYVFGHIVLHDTHVEHAYYGDDVRFMDALADFLGFLLVEFRTKQKKLVMHELSLLPLNNPQKLYAKVADYLKCLYGVISFQIWAVNFSSQEWELAWPEKKEKILTNQLVTDDFQNKITHFANENKFLGRGEPLEFQLEGQNYLVTPMRAGISAERVIGAFIIPSNRPGKVALSVIDEVSDALGNRLNSRHRQHRYKSLTIFVNEVSSLPSNNLTQEQVLQIAYERISDVMFSKNIYIALYDAVEDTISFPLIYRNGKTWEKMHNQKRKIDPTKLGRTEVIIRNNSPLLIKTKAESVEWYSKPTHQNYAIPLASWVGVPIFAGNGHNVRGVIAAYHDDLDYVYSDRDVFFLENVAGAVSGLFRLLDLKEANRNLEEAKRTSEEKSKLIEIQEGLLRIYLAKKLEKLINRDALDVQVSLEATIEDLNRAYHTGDVSLLEDMITVQEDAKEKFENITQAIRSIKQDAADESEKFLIPTVIRKAKNDSTLKINELLYSGDMEKLYINTGEAYFYVCFSLIFEAISDVFAKLEETPKISYQISLEDQIRIDFFIIPRKILPEIAQHEKIGFANSILHSKFKGETKISMNSLAVEIKHEYSKELDIGIALENPWLLRVKQTLRKYDINNSFRTMNIQKNNDDNSTAYDILIFDPVYLGQDIDLTIENYQCKKYLIISDDHKIYETKKYDNVYIIEKKYLQDHEDVFSKLLQE